MAKSKKDEIVQELLQIVKKKREEIEKIQKPEWQTNCVVMVEGRTSNLRAINSIEKAIETFSVIVAAKKVYEETVEILGIKEEINFTFNGFSFDKWSNDFRNVTNLITVKEKVKDLEEDEAKLDKLVSKEKREELELEMLLKKHKGE